MRNEMGSSSRNPEGHRGGQLGSSSRRGIDISRQMSESGKLREAQADGCSNEQQGQRRNQEISHETGGEVEKLLKDIEGCL